MEKLPAVETAKSLMTEAVTWSVIKWLREKKTVLKIADQANAVLDQMSRSVKDCWPDEVRAAYEILVTNSGSSPRDESDLPAGNGRDFIL
jgi:hypothetical protein